VRRPKFRDWATDMPAEENVRFTSNILLKWARRSKNLDALLAFYDFPADDWNHLRTSNPIESLFATVRHRNVRTKGSLFQKTAKLMVFKLV
jgi:transposase-like protein